MKEFINKQKSFSLSEVLVALVVIGVLAAFTIPNLINSAQDKELKTLWKKTYSDINNAYSLVVKDNGGTMSGVLTNDVVVGSRDLASMLLQYLSYTNYKSSTASTGYNANYSWHPYAAYATSGQDAADNIKFYNGTYGLHTNSGGYPCFTLSNGAFVCVHGSSDNTCAASNRLNNYRYCGYASIDVNGAKKPNTVGKDIYFLSFMSDRVIPYCLMSGACPYYGDVSDCTPEGKGIGCSAKWLLE